MSEREVLLAQWGPLNGSTQATPHVNRDASATFADVRFEPLAIEILILPRLIGSIVQPQSASLSPGNNG